MPRNVGFARGRRKPPHTSRRTERRRSGKCRSRNAISARSSGECARPRLRGARRRKGDRLPVVEVAGDHHRVDVRRAADRRRVAELRRHEPHRKRDVPTRLGLRPRGPKLGEHRRRAQRRAPRAEVLGAVVPSPGPALQVRVDVARAKRPPVGAALVREHARAGRAQLPRDETHERAIGDDLPLPDLSLPAVHQPGGAGAHANVRLAERRDAERAVLAQIALAAHAAERLADQAKHRRGDGVDVQRTRGGGGPRVVFHRAAQMRQFLRQLSHAVVLPQLAPLDGTGVVPVLLAPARVEPPRLNRRSRRPRDVHVAPGRRNAQRVDAHQRPPIADHAVVGVAILEPVPRARAANPRDHGTAFRKPRASKRAR